MGNMVADGCTGRRTCMTTECSTIPSRSLHHAGGLRADIRAPAGATLPLQHHLGRHLQRAAVRETLFLMEPHGCTGPGAAGPSATLYKGMLQSSGLTFRWYNSCGCSTPTEWSAFDARVDGRVASIPRRTYRVVRTNSCAPGWRRFAAFVAAAPTAGTRLLRHAAWA